MKMYFISEDEYRKDICRGTRVPTIPITMARSIAKNNSITENLEIWIVDSKEIWAEKFHYIFDGWSELSQEGYCYRVFVKDN